jgi:uncharacterized pyridoxamine 5'-phosphate oxidase family protein
MSSRIDAGEPRADSGDASAMPKTGQLSLEDVARFERDAKIGLLATVDPQGLPHVSLITSIQAKSADKLMFGQFCEGLSKKHVKDNPRTGFLVMSQEKELWRGKARWTGEAKSGEDYEMYNRKPMFRYNSYFGIHTVHYLELVEFRGKESLSAARIVVGYLVTTLAKRLAVAEPRKEILKPWAEKLLGGLGTLKFISHIREDGYPAIVPVVPCQPAGSGRLVFAPGVHRRELAAVPAGATVAVFALNLQMESVLVRGCFTGYRRYMGLKAGAIDIDWVYNSMPPMQGPIHPVESVPPTPNHRRSA